MFEKYDAMVEKPDNIGELLKKNHEIKSKTFL